MKIVLQQGEFEKMAESWVFENLVEKKMASASIVDNAIELEVFGDGESRQEPLVYESPDEDNFDDEILTSKD